MTRNRHPYRPERTERRTRAERRAVKRWSPER